MKKLYSTITKFDLDNKMPIKLEEELAYVFLSNKTVYSTGIYYNFRQLSTLFQQKYFLTLDKDECLKRRT